MAQEEILKFLEDNKQTPVHFTANEISQRLFNTTNDRKVRRALRGLVAYGEIEIKFKRVQYGFIPCYRLVEKNTKK